MNSTGVQTLRVLFVGDVIGSPGRAMFQKHIAALKKKYAIAMVIVNGENSAKGKGITSRIAQFFRHNHADVITTGNHVWYQKEIYGYLDQHRDVLRPANYPATCPGVGVTIVPINGVNVAVLNLMGRTFMGDTLECPFRTADSLLSYVHHKTTIVVLDFHAETTSEKIALGHYLDGRISAQVGTHTHVQTADERILPGGTAFITDLGMVGARNSAIGVRCDAVIQRFLTQMPHRFTVENRGPMILCGAWVEIDVQTGKAVAIERVQVIDDQIHVDEEE